MITVIVSTSTPSKPRVMPAKDPQNKVAAVESDELIEQCHQFTANAPENSVAQAAVAEGREIAAIVSTLELPPRLTAAALVYPLIREKVCDTNDLENNHLDELSRIVVGLVELGHFVLPEDWRPGRSTRSQTIGCIAQDAVGDGFRHPPGAGSDC